METKINWKLPKKNQLVIMLLIGILLVVIAMPTEKKEKNTGQPVEMEQHSADSYEKMTEKRLEQILGKVEGVGKVKVMVTFKTTSEKIVEKDREENAETTIYNSTSGGEQTPYVSKEIHPQIEGVVVIAEGGANAVIVKNITEAVQALFDVDTHKIKVMKGG